MDNYELYRRMLLIRKSEKKVEELFSKGMLKGTTHGYIGQEAVAVGLLSHIDIDKDYVTGGHRSHGHYLAINPDPYPFFAELMGKESGLVGGRGGSQHISYKNFFTNGITGGMVPVATGIAFALKKTTKNQICVIFIGDGAFNEGYVMEALNLASVFKLPIIFAMENNSFAMSTAFSYSCRGCVENRVLGFGLPYYKIKADDVNNVYDFSMPLVAKVRKDRLPLFVEYETFRFSGHSKSDKREYIPQEMDKYWYANDALLKIEERLDTEMVCKIKKEVDYVIENAVNKALKDHEPKLLRSNNEDL